MWVPHTLGGCHTKHANTVRRCGIIWCVGGFFRSSFLAAARMCYSQWTTMLEPNSSLSWTSFTRSYDHFISLYDNSLSVFVLQIQLEVNFEAWRNYKDNKSLSASKRRCMMGNWLHLGWGHLLTQESFIKKSFDNTLLIRKDAANRLTLKRLGRTYVPSFEKTW